MIYDVAIIGGGPGGLTSAIYALRSGFSVLLIEKMAPGGQMLLTSKIENYPGIKEIEGYELSLKMEEQARNLGCNFVYENINKLELKDKIKKIYTSSNIVFEAKTVILATGASERKLGIKNEEFYLGKGLSYCATCDGNFYKDKIVTIVGGGNSAIADLLILINLAKHVNVVYRGDKFKASKIYMEKIKKLNNISLFYNSKVKDIKLNDDKISEITIFNKLDNKFLDIKTDGLFISIGRDPNNELFMDQITLTKEGYIDADETTKTNIDGVYAVGDIRSKPLRQIITACSDGAVAVKFIEDYLSINF